MDDSHLMLTPALEIAIIDNCLKYHLLTVLESYI